MSIVLVRVDQRLLHGQVVEGWVPFLKADTVVVADDAIAGDPISVIAMNAACPSRVKLAVMNLLQATEAAASAGGLPGKRTLLLVGSVQSLDTIWRGGCRAGAVNVGNVPLAPGRARVTPSVALSKEELATLDGIAATGATVEAKAVPKERGVDLPAIHKLVDAEGTTPA